MPRKTVPAVERCPCCHQIVPPRLIFEHQPVKQRIYDFIAAHPEGVTRAQLFDHVYAGDIDGGPLHLSTISVHIWGMNPVLERHGLMIRGARGPGSTFKLMACSLREAAE